MSNLTRKSGEPIIGVIRKKQPNGRIISVKVAHGQESSFHATKGWRYRSVAPAV